jgi:hypothetical protein
MDKSCLCVYLVRVRIFLSPSLIINIVDESKRTHRHKIWRLLFISTNIDDYYNMEPPCIYSPTKEEIPSTWRSDLFNRIRNVVHNFNDGQQFFEFGKNSCGYLELAESS